MNLNSLEKATRQSVKTNTISNRMSAILKEVRLPAVENRSLQLSGQGAVATTVKVALGWY